MNAAAIRVDSVTCTIGRSRILDSVSLDIAPAYPSDIGLDSWVRTVTLYRGKRMEVEDAFSFSGPPKDLYLSLITPCQVVLQKQGKMTLKEVAMDESRTTGNAKITYDSSQLVATAEPIPLEDDKLRKIWGKQLTRIILKSGTLSSQ